jgi:site-specific DNA-cytosine methylase
MHQSISARDFVKISDAARLLGVTEQTLRNWDRARKLKPVRHPVNGYRMYRVADLHSILGKIGNNEEQAAFDFASSGKIVDIPLERSNELDALPPCHWSLAVALDPKHRPQQWNAPSTTVRRDWRKFPQEAHILDASGTKFRRFSAEEIALLQGFDPDVVALPELTERERIAALGDAVPPPLARALLRGISANHRWCKATALEICAGAGGLAEGAAAAELEHLNLIDASENCAKILRNRRCWSPEVVIAADVREFNFSAFRGHLGLLSGGPPCQPWSQSGLHMGHDDRRDLLGSLPEIVAAIQPEVFLFENVPGLASEQNRPYLNDVINRLRRPDENLSYGVLAAIFNAADFGVPQVRERMFILGIKGASAVTVSKCFDTVECLQTHQRPGGTRPAIPNWVTIGSVLEARGDPGGWRRWITHQ